MPRITFRPDREVEQLLTEAFLKTGIKPSELCRLAIASYFAKTNPTKIVRESAARRVRVFQSKKKVTP